MRKNILKSILLTTLLVISGCVKDDEYLISNTPENSKSEISSQENFVSLNEIKEIGNKIIFPTKDGSISGKGSQSSKKTIASIADIKNKNGKASFYVINYNEGGFVILSADKRTRPILGFSNENEFIIDESSYPLGLQFWMDDTKDQIADIQNSEVKQASNEKLAWERVAADLPSSLSGKEDDPPAPCNDHTEVITKGPLLNSTWSQQGAFNDQLPFITCNGGQFQVFAGCVPIAMGQIMRYHQFPTTYNWANMPAGFGNNTTALFIEDIHDGINNVYSTEPQYTCTGTGVAASANMGTVLKTGFGYSSATFTSYNYTTVKSNISSNRPVILSGDNGTTGHMWVCDGWRTTTYYYANCTAVQYLSFNMNWGWLNGSNNGWYAFGNFNPAGTNYNSNKKMVYNIIP